MNQDNDSSQPSWDFPLTIKITAEGLIHALYSTATNVHTGWNSCVSTENVIAEVILGDDTEGNYCRLLEQEFATNENADNETVWHDWSVEVKLGEAYITGHWQTEISAQPFEWEWCEAQASEAFSKAAVLFGKRVRRGGLVIEETFSTETSAKTTRH